VAASTAPATTQSRSTILQPAQFHEPQQYRHVDFISTFPRLQSSNPPCSEHHIHARDRRILNESQRGSPIYGPQVLSVYYAKLGSARACIKLHQHNTTPSPLVISSPGCATEPCGAIPANCGESVKQQRTLRFLPRYSNKVMLNSTTDR
jgi:hypothetical protein